MGLSFITPMLLGGAALVAAQAPVWTIFALVAVGMAAYGTASILLVHRTPWGPPQRPVPVPA